MAVVVKTINGTAYAGVKTWCGTPVASMKTLVGMDVTSGGGGGYTLLYDSVNVGSTSSINFGASVNNPYAGLYAFNDVARTIGKVTVVLNSVGTITSKTLNLRIYSTNGSNDLVSAVGTSDNVTGASWSNTAVDFVFSTPCSLSASTNYCFAVDLNGTDGSNYAQMVYVNTASASSPPPGNLGYWYGGGLYITTYGTLSPQMKIYTTP